MDNRLVSMASRMAEILETAEAHCVEGKPTLMNISPADLDIAATMLRAYAEVVEVDAAMVNRAREAYRIRLNQHVAASFDGDALQDAMHAALTAALSTRVG